MGWMMGLGGCAAFFYGGTAPEPLAPSARFFAGG